MSNPDEPNGPVLPGPGASDYERYLRTDELLALQREPAQQLHRDELLFQTVHQSSELWLKLACAEVQQAAELIDADRIGPAGRLLRRAVLCLQYVTAQLDMLDQLNPWEYHQIRLALGHGSGFDSPGFRQVARVTPVLSGAFDRALERAGAPLTEIYRRPDEFDGLYDLAELLTDWDERITTWRSRHYGIVMRAIGEETVGTQGTPVPVLGKLVAQRRLPRLWEVRSRLVELFEAEQTQP
ncbi:MAG: tryptophan 2,3-dioxygenase family protein [Solirubrobacteraceae bacterium]